MSSQTFLPWFGEHAFSIILVVSLVVIAYILYSLTFNRRIFPFLLERRVSDVLQKPGSDSKITPTPPTDLSPTEKDKVS